MAIRELSHERRNMMIPRYWRYVERVYLPGPVNMGGWTVIMQSGIFTPTEPSHVWVLHDSRCVGRAPAGQRYYQYDLQVSVGGGGFAPLTVHTQGMLIAASANYETNSIQAVHENVAAGVTLQYQIAATGAAGMTSCDWYDLELELQICRA